MEVKKINFTSSKPIPAKSVKLQDLSDEDVVKISVGYASGQVSKTNSAKVLKALPAVAVGSLALIGAASKPGKLSTKIGTGLGILTGFALVSGVFDGVSKLFDKAENQSKYIKETRKDHPVVSEIFKVAAGLVAATYALKGANFGLKKLANMFPDAAKSVLKNNNNLKKIVDESKFAKIAENISEKYAKFKSNHKGLANFISKNSFPLVLASYFAASFGLSASVEEKRSKIANDVALKLFEEKYKNI